MLRVRDLVIAPAGRPLAPVGFELGPGQAIGIVGPSGIGKTTLLRTLAWLDGPASGSVQLDHQTPGELGVPRFRRAVCYLAQEPQLGPGTVAEALARPFTYRTAERPYPEDEGGQLLERLLLPRALLGRTASDLSTGERQRVALARAVLLGPRVLLADEPSSALDPEATSLVEDLIADCRAAGLALVLVSHDAEQRRRLVDTTVALEAA